MLGDHSPLDELDDQLRDAPGALTFKVEQDTGSGFTEVATKADSQNEFSSGGAVGLYNNDNTTYWDETTVAY